MSFDHKAYDFDWVAFWKCRPALVRPHLHCPTVARYALHEVGGIFTCRICANPDYAYRHIDRHTPQLNWRVDKSINSLIL